MHGDPVDYLKAPQSDIYKVGTDSIPSIGQVP